MLTQNQIFFVVSFVIFGSLKRISLDYMTRTEAMGQFHSHFFDHRLLQLASTNFGEIFCLAVFGLLIKFRSKVKKEGGENQNFVDKITDGSRDFNRFKMMTPAFLHLISWLCMYFGRQLTYTSTFVMLYGSTVLFVACFTKKKVYNYQLVGMFLVFSGTVIIALGDYYIYDFKELSVWYSLANEPQHSTMDILLGEGLVMISLMVIAFKNVMEEDIMQRYKIPPLLVVGYEGLFNFIIVTVALIIFAVVPSNSMNDTFESLHQIKNSTALMKGLIFLIIFGMLTSYTGVETTKRLSAMLRVVFESLQMLIYFETEILIDWKIFHWLHVRISRINLKLPINST